MASRLFRIRSNAFYLSLTEDQKAAYRAGLPVRHAGHQLRDLKFLPYHYGTDITKKTVTEHKQQYGLIDFCNQQLGPAGVYSATMAFHSSPTDEAAFNAAGSIFETALAKHLSCLCVSTTTLTHTAHEIPAHDVYLIHGVNDTPGDRSLWALRDFLRDRDGSLRLVVLTSPSELHLDQLIHERLRMHFDYLVCLDDEAKQIERVHGGRSVRTA